MRSRRSSWRSGDGRRSGTSWLDSRRVSEIQWAAPPATAIFNGGTRGRYAAFSDALRGRPGEWAVFPREGGSSSSASSAAANIRAGKTKGFEPKGAFETAVDGATIYVRFVGEPSQAGEPANSDALGEHDEVTKGPTGAEVRAWAKAQGMEPRPGRLPAELWRAYKEAHDLQPESH